MVCRTFNDNWRWSAKSFCRGRLSLYVITGIAAAFTAGFEIPQAPGLDAVGFDEEVHAAAVEKLIGAFAGFSRAALQVAEGDR